ncbi:unnamed protein product [Brachionus calyciflorus]|uniref:Uncharacterized protein n=1 Tax=Brachionus calyciflorus TaxID=104777 RepID=A0A814BGJ2_9BILA|nr:unnamed protein product [Brachionus calyciflorus]
MDIPKITPPIPKSQKLPVIATISYSLISSYVFASYSTKEKFHYEKERQMYILSMANGGLGGLLISKFYGLKFPFTFLHTILGYTLGGAFYPFTNYLRERQLKISKT